MKFDTAVTRDAAKALHLLAVVALLIALTAAHASAQTVAGSVTELTGTAYLQRGTARSGVTLNMLVQTGDRLNTDSNSFLTITLTDASKLQMGESSVLVIDEHVLGAGGGRARTQVSLFTGFVRSFVNLTAGGSPNFEVHTPNAVAAARGTDFATGYEEGSTRPGLTGCNRFTDVAVYDGVVGLSQPGVPNAPEVSITAGYETSVPCGLSPLSPGPLGFTGASTTSSGGHAAGGGGAGGGGGGGAGGGPIGVTSPPTVGAPPPSCPPCPP